MAQPPVENADFPVTAAVGFPEFGIVRDGTAVVLAAPIR